MEIVYSDRDLENYMDAAVAVSNESPVLLDRFLESAIEIDVDAICDGESVFIGGIMEHIEQAGIHSGDSACVLPPHTLSGEVQDELVKQVELMARGLGVIGLMNTQFAIRGEEIYVLEVNPRASRTAPFVSKSIGISLPYVAARCMMGESLSVQGIRASRSPPYYSVKEAVFPFVKFPGVDPLLGPEMKSTGEVMGVGATFGEAFGKAQEAANMAIPSGGTAFVSVRDQDKERVVELARTLEAQGFHIVSTKGTAACLLQAGIECQVVNKVLEGHPHIVDLIENDAIDLIINTTEGEQAISDSYSLRASALLHRVSYTTTLAGAAAAVMAVTDASVSTIRCLQDLHRECAS
jgi:carbamoyl-phosphate synthase large subunit